MPVNHSETEDASDMKKNARSELNSSVIETGFFTATPSDG